MKLILAILAFNLIVLIHEFGHYIVAKYYGIKVYEFSLFIGPKLFSFNFKGTMFSVRTIPMLAYVAFDKEDALYEDKSLNSQPKRARAAVLAAGPLINILAGAVAFAIVFFLAGYDTTKISRVYNYTPASEAGIHVGDKVVSINNKAIYHPLEADLFLIGVPKGVPIDIEVERGDEKIPLKITPLLIPENRSLIGFQSKSINGEATTQIGSLVPGGPAEKAGLLAGDIILKLDNTNVESMQQVLNFLYQNRGEEVKVTVSRNGQMLSPVVIKPTHDNNPEIYSTQLYFSSERGNIFDVLKYTVIDTYSFVRIGVYSIGWLVQGKVPLNQMGGAVGAVDMINTVVQQSTSVREVIVYLLKMSAFISIALGVTNFVPIPNTDGGKLILLGVEAIRRKPLSQEKETYLMMVGFGLLIVLFIFTLYNDIARIIIRTIGG